MKVKCDKYTEECDKMCAHRGIHEKENKWCGEPSYCGALNNMTTCIECYNFKEDINKILEI
jgi:hypothetical protein